MNRTEFIKSLMDLYPRTFDKAKPLQYQGWIDRYKNAIPENWDFKKLMWHFETKWHSVIEPPPPSFFYKFKEDVKPEKKYQKIELTPEEIEKSNEGYKKFKDKLKYLIKEKSL